MTKQDFTERCQWARCRASGDLIYFDIGLCETHWKRACADSERRGWTTMDIVYENLVNGAKTTMRRAAERTFEQHKRGETGS